MPLPLPRPEPRPWEQMAVEVEQPFGDDPDDLPLEEYCLGLETICLDFLKRVDM